MTEDVRIASVAVTEDGHYRIILITDNGSHTIELDYENAMRFAAELLKLCRE